MATADVSTENSPLCEKINYNEIQEISIIGEGSYGQVYKGTYRGSYVALKRVIQGLDEKEDNFIVEIRQLARTNHDNIISLFGACIDKRVLVMEYADGGSLYKLLHGSKCEYLLMHAMSWAYQCAKGVEYLHSFELIHRDLKPPNLLLFNGRTLLKICDFGTVADKRTYMTNNKGSAAWMAPEVFSTTDYVEKCDVYSWGIIFWEVLSRRIPFNRRAPALSVLWSVYKGKRPPLLINCPSVIQKLIVKCWDAKPEERPTMSQIVKIMEALLKYVPGKLEPIISDDDICEEEEEEYDEEYYTEGTEHIYDEIDPFRSANTQSTRRPELPQPTGDIINPLHVDVDPNCWDIVDYEMRTMPGFDRLATPPGPSSTETGMQRTNISQSNSRILEDSNLDTKVYVQLLDAHLRPITPDPSNPQSVALYQNHVSLAQELVKVQTEQALLSAKKLQLQSQSQPLDEQQLREAKQRLESEKNSWLQTKRYLEEQKQNQASQNGIDDWVIVNGGDNR